MIFTPRVGVGYPPPLSFKDGYDLLNGVNIPDGLIVPDSLDPGKPEGKAARVTIALIDRVKGHLEDHLGTDDVYRAMPLDGDVLEVVGQCLNLFVRQSGIGLSNGGESFALPDR